MKSVEQSAAFARVSRAVVDVHRLAMICRAKLAFVDDDLPEIEETSLSEVVGESIAILRTLDARLIEYFGGEA